MVLDFIVNNLEIGMPDFIRPAQHIRIHTSPRPTRVPDSYDGNEGEGKNYFLTLYEAMNIETKKNARRTRGARAKLSNS